MEVLPINKKAIPNSFEIQLGVNLYTISVDYNLKYDFFTLSLAKDDVRIITAQKIVYGRPLFELIPNYLSRDFTLIPLDPSGNESVVDWENFYESVFIFAVEN